MKLEELEHTIDAAFEDAGALTPDTQGDIRDAVDAALDLLDAGTARVAKKSVMTGTSINGSKRPFIVFPVERDDYHLRRPGRCKLVGQSAVKFDGWDSARFTEAGFRAVPNCVVRRSAYIAPGVVLMPSFVNLGLCRQRHHGRHLGNRRLMRANRQKCSYFGRCRYWRRSGTFAGQSGDCGRWLLHWRALRGCRGCDCARGRGFVDGGFITSSTKIVDRATGKSIAAKCRPIRS